MTESTTRQPHERNKDAKGSYASVNGLTIYYEIHGTGKPLVLLHGGLATIDPTFRSLHLHFLQNCLESASTLQGLFITLQYKMASRLNSRKKLRNEGTTDNSRFCFLVVISYYWSCIPSHNLQNRRGKAPVIHAGDENAVPYGA